ncbi:unnamed protein product [Prorocentrum cordatum]|uniref:RING-type domain-containing protein n=1 Tax=Prorocentrum cordatum TaxID=2364126 RepID=A0ABN9YFJ1_9DINO|nr:unnamed protein product [Polarella glacialis]
MGNNPSQQALDSLAGHVRSGDLPAAMGFLQRLSEARTAPAGAKRNRESEALKALDLNEIVSSTGFNILQLAATSANPQVLRALLDPQSHGLDLPKVQIDAMNGERRTALHCAAGCQSQRSAECVQVLLEHRADPCIAAQDGTTPLDVARRVRNVACVRTLESSMKLWAGWVDHDEVRMLALPNWQPMWMVVLQDRRVNSGRWAGAVNVTCFNCQTTLRAPAYAFTLTCSRCMVEVAVTPSLQIALYEAPLAASGATHTLPDAAMPTVVIYLPMDPTQLIAKPLEEAGIKSFVGSLFEGRVRRALQSTSVTTRSFGFTMKILDRGALREERSFRVETEADRVQLLRVLQNTAQASYEASRSVVALAPAAAALGAPLAEQAVAGPPPGAAAGPWACGQCTYEHAGPEARLPACAVCGAPRGPLGGPPAHGAPPGPPEPSAPPLEPEELARVAPPLPAAGQAGAAAAAPEAGNAVSDDRLCIICMERRADSAVVPCGHMCCCEQCLQGIRGTEGAECPMCRGPMTSTMRIYCP